MRLGTFSGSGLGFGLAFSLYDDFTQTARRIEREMMTLQGLSTQLASTVEASMTRIRVGITGVVTAIIGLAGFVKAAKVDAEFQRYAFGIETFVGSAQKAQDIMAQIRKDALANPKLDFASMAQSNMMLMAGGVDAEQSQRMIKNLSTILFAVGRGSEELMRMGINLQQLAAGAFNQRDVTQFGYAGIDLMKLLRDATGKTDAQIKAMGFSVDLLDMAFSKATEKGTIYSNALGRALENNDAKMAYMGENIKFTWAAIGLSIRDITAEVLDSINHFLEKLQAFASSPFGSWVMRTTAILFGLLGVFSLLLLATSLTTKMTYSMANAFGVSTRVTILKALAEHGSAAALWVMAKATIRATIAALPMIAAYAAIGAVAYYVIKSMREFGAVMNDNAAPQSGFVGFLQKLGGLLTWVGTLWTSYDSAKHRFEVPESMLMALDRLGIGETARNLATWIARFKELFAGIGEGVRDSIDFVKSFFKDLGNMLGISDDWLSRNTSSLDTWRSVGYYAAVMIATGLGYVIAQFVFLKAMAIVSLVWDIASGFLRLGLFIFGTVVPALASAVVGLAATNFELILMSGLIYFSLFLLALLGYAFYKAFSDSEDAFSSMTQHVNGYQDTILGALNTMGEAGGIYGSNLRTGWDSALENWNPFQPIIDKWIEFKEFIGDIGHLGAKPGSTLYEILETSSNPFHDLMISDQQLAAEEKAQNDRVFAYKNPGRALPGAGVSMSKFYDVNDPNAVSTPGNQMGGEPSGTFTPKATPQTVTIPIYIDSRLLTEKVIENLELQRTTEH